MVAIAKKDRVERCVGREKELAFLRDAWESAGRDGERLVLVRGASGVGKTTLLEEFRRRLRLDGAVVLEGTCGAGARPTTPLADILDRAVSFLDEVRQPIDLDVERLSFLLDDGAPQARVDEGTDAIERRVAFFEAYSDVLRALSRVKPPVVILHDLHKADELTVDLIAHLLEGSNGHAGAEPVDRTFYGLVVASLRAGEPATAMRSLAFHPRGSRIDLEGFDVAGVREFLQSSSVVERLTAATGGNPAELSALLQRPAVASDELFRNRLSGLSGPARQIVAAMSVIGRAARSSFVSDLSGVDDPGPAIEELEEAGFLTRSFQRGGVVLSMSSSKDFDEVYKALTHSERRELHGRAARLLEGARGMALQELAVHAIRAGDPDRAVPAALGAAETLEAAYAYEAAASLLEDAQTVARAPEHTVLGERIAGLCQRTGQYHRALAHAVEVVRVRPGDASARLTVGRLRARSGDVAGAASDLDDARGLALELGDRELLREIAAERAEVHFLAEEYDAALALCEEYELGRDEVTRTLRNTRGKIELVRGRLVEAGRVFEENLVDARHADDRHREAQALTNLGIVALRMHRHDMATRRFEAALAIAQRVHDLREAAIAQENLGVLAHTRADLGAALGHYRAAVAALEPLGNVPLLLRAVHNLAELQLLMGDLEAAQNMADYAEALTGEATPRELRGEGLLLRARLASKRGANEQAKDLWLEARQLYSDLEQPSRLAEIELGLARVALRASDVKGATRLLESARARQLDTSARAEAAMIEAEIEVARFGDPLRALLLAVDCWTEAGDLDGAWRAHLLVAEALGRCGDDEGRDRHLERASSLAARVRAGVPEASRKHLDADPQRLRLREALDARTADVPLRPPAPRSLPPVEDGASLPAPSAPSSPPPAQPLANHAALKERFPHIVWQSDAMAGVLSRVERIASSGTQVLIRGESGTGKELVAELIHRLSDRRAKPMVKVNCAALVESLLLDELFGHEKGAFTGALQRRKGRFEAADGGTLFLDEIGDISPKTQVSLLRVLQEQVFERVGGTEPIHVDVRLICATNRDLEAAVADGTFREDLYYRLKGIPIELPPLRERAGDVALLARHFLTAIADDRGERAQSLSAEALALLERHHWPGNVRELENVVRAASLMTDGPVIDASVLLEHTELGRQERSGAHEVHARPSRPAMAPPPPAQTTPPPADPAACAAPTTAESPTSESSEPLTEPPFDEVLDGELSLRQWQKKLEAEYIEKALRRTGWNITQAAVLLGMKRPRLSQLVKEHGLSERRES